MTDQRPTRQYPCPHCQGGDVVEDHIDYWPITRPCGYCEGRGYFERPVLPRGAMRAFRVSWWDPVPDVEHEEIVHATSAAKAKMLVARAYTDHPESDTTMRDALTTLHVRRAPEHDPITEGA